MLRFSDVSCKNGCCGVDGLVGTEGEGGYFDKGMGCVVDGVVGTEGEGGYFDEGMGGDESQASG